MAALSLHSVQAQAREDVSEHIRLVYNRATSTYTWVYSHAGVYNDHVVPVAKIRDLKMAQWMDEARTLLNRVVGGETKAKPVVAEERPPQPMPGFMIVGKGTQAPKPFDPDPEVQGGNDARAGITACPYSLPDAVAKWNRGHDRACAQDPDLKPRFGLTTGRRN